MFAEVVVFDLTVISSGSCRYFFEMRRIVRGHRRREQCDLLVVGGVGEDGLHVLREPHLQHLVGLVEHEVLQLGQVERALVEVVHDAAGRADDDVDAASQCRELHAVSLAAVDGQQVHALHVGRVALERLGDLEGELAGRGQHERLRALLRQVEAGQDGQRERGRLAGAGLGESDDVAPFEQQRDGRGLDGGRGLVADILQGLQDGAIQPQGGEGHGVVGGLSVAVRGIWRSHRLTVAPTEGGVGTGRDMEPFTPSRSARPAAASGCCAAARPTARRGPGARRPPLGDRPPGRHGPRP